MAGTWVAPDLIGETEFIKVGDTPVELLGALDLKACAPVFTVPNDGRGVLLQAFNLCTALKIRMVQTYVQGMPNGGPDCQGCDDMKEMDILPTGVRLVETVDQIDASNDCGMWGMSPGANMGILTVPGAYRICACEETDAGQFSLIARTVSKEAMANIPTPLIFGYN